MQKHKKKTLCLSPRSKALKREHENENENLKRTKFENEHFSESINFIKACELVNQKAHEDLSSRLQILHLPICTKNCKHIGSKLEIQQIAPHAEEIFMLEFRSNKWYEALEVCFLSIHETTYLSENILKNIIEIMMNAHEDPESQYKVPHLINKCQQVLSMNIKTHPPCSFEPVRKCYLNFLTAPMDLRKNTKTNRCDFDSTAGIFQYCINRLESELHIDSKDEPLFDKEMLIPEEIKQTIQGVHYEKSRLEIFEMLNRTDRIDRLMAVMDSLAELIGFDLAIYHSRLLKGEISLRRQRILITTILELNDLKNDKMNDLCKQVMKIYIYFIHLNYPEKFINTMNFWINSIIETLYTMEKKDHKDPDFLKIGRKCKNFSSTFHEMIIELPPDSILKIIERITPTHMRYYVGMLHCDILLSETIGSNIMKTLINFIEESLWKKFSKSKNETIPEIKKNTKQLTPDNILKNLIRIIKNKDISCHNGLYQKFKPVDETFVNDQIYVTQVLNVTVHAYLDAYHLHKMHKTLNKLNNELSENKSCDSLEYFAKLKNSYVTQASVKIYRDIYKDLKQCFRLIQNIKSKEKLPKILCIFENNFDLKEL